MRVDKHLLLCTARFQIWGRSHEQIKAEFIRCIWHIHSNYKRKCFFLSNIIQTLYWCTEHNHSVCIIKLDFPLDNCKVFLFRSIIQSQSLSEQNERVKSALSLHWYRLFPDTLISTNEQVCLDSSVYWYSQISACHSDDIWPVIIIKPLESIIQMQRTLPGVCAVWPEAQVSNSSHTLQLVFNI